MQSFDLFGSEIMFRFRGIATHNTKFGSIFTLGILAIICLRLFFIVKEVFLRNSPTVIFQERQVDNPDLFTMNPKTFQFAFGMQAPSYDHYVNERIYTYTMQQQHKKTSVDANGVAQTTWDVKDINLVPCTLANFDDEVTVEYFKKQTYQNLLCFPPEESHEIQGDFSSPDFQQIVLTLKACEGTNCEDPSVLEEYLASGYFAIYFSDVFIDPTEKSDPFHRYARDMFWTTSTTFPKYLNWYMRNNYIESDFGWFYEDITTQHFPSYGMHEVSILPAASADYFFQITFRMEKSKESLYQRKYKNVNSIISEIGGFTQSLLAIGFLICSRLSQLDLNKEIINEAFNFETVKEDDECFEDGKFGQGENLVAAPAGMAGGISPEIRKYNRSIDNGGGGGGGISPTMPILNENGKKPRLSVIMSEQELENQKYTGAQASSVVSGTANGVLGSFGNQFDSINSFTNSNSNTNNNNNNNEIRSGALLLKPASGAINTHTNNYQNNALTQNNIDSSLTQSQLAQPNFQPSMFMNAFKPKQIRGNRRLSASVQQNDSYLSADLISAANNVTHQNHLRSANETRVELNNNSTLQYQNDATHVGNVNLDLRKQNNGTQLTQQQLLNEQKKAESERRFLSFLIQNPGNGNLSQTGSGVYAVDPVTNQQEAISSDHEKLQAQQQKLEEKLERQKESDFKRLMHKTTSSMSLNVWEYLKFFLWPFGEVKQKKKIIDYSIDKLYYHLDVLYVVKKLLEVDKLKRILLDQHQLKLFEYIPKPTIRTAISSDENGKEDVKMDIDKHYQDSRTELQKAQEAFVAYKALNAKPSLNKIDQNILNLLDPRLVDLFEVPFNQLSKHQNGTEPVQTQIPTQTHTLSNQNNIASLMTNSNNNPSILAKQQQPQQQQHSHQGNQCNGNCSAGINAILASIQSFQQQHLHNTGTQIEQQNTSAISQFQSINQLPQVSNNGLKSQAQQVMQESLQSLQQQQSPYSRPNSRSIMVMGNGSAFQASRVFEKQKESPPSTNVPANHPTVELSVVQNPVSNQNNRHLSNPTIIKGLHVNTFNNNNLQEDIEDPESNVNQIINSQIPVNSIGDIILNSPHHIDSNRSMFSDIASDEEKNKSYPLEFGMADAANPIFK